MPQSLLSMVESIYTVVAATGLRRSVVHFDARNIPETAVTDSFCVAFQSSNTKDLRDSPVIRMLHTVSITMLFRIYPDQDRTIATHTEAEEKVLSAVLTTDHLPNCHAMWSRTSRSITADREKMLVQMDFEVRADWQWWGGNTA